MEIKNKLQEIFRDIFDIEDLVIGARMNSDDINDWDSLAHINLIVAIESEFNIKFKLGELQGLKDVGEIIKIISSKVKN